MTTLEIPLDDDLKDFALRQSRALGHASATAYIESLLAIERLRERKTHVDAMLQQATSDGTQPVDDEYWKRVESEI